MAYKVNPKMKGSGLLACIPQKGRCPNNCDHCFFQSGRSYLEPLEENTPNMPSVEQTIGRVVRVNDGNDSNVYRHIVKDAVKFYPLKFFNTSIPTDLEFFEDPVVLTLNPAEMTDKEFYKLSPIPKNLMFVRIRANMWNLVDVIIPAVSYYAQKKVPVVLTFMAYYEDEEDKFPKDIPIKYKSFYKYRKRTTNKYYAITTLGWELIMREFKYNKWVHSCGKIEGKRGDTHCRFCGNCLREYFATMERIRKPEYFGGLISL